MHFWVVEGWRGVRGDDMTKHNFVLQFLSDEINVVNFRTIEAMFKDKMLVLNTNTLYLKTHNVRKGI